MIRPLIRSLLYVPASSERFIARAHTRGADAIILDLEDSVVAGEKIKARARLAAAVAHVGQAGARVFVRINATRDLIHGDAEAACEAGAFGILVPKTRDPRVLFEMDALLGLLEHKSGREPMAVVPLIEDAAGVFEARAIARGPRVLALNTGGLDLAASMEAEPAADVLRLPILLVHLAAKAEGRLSLGTLAPISDYSDAGGIRAAAVEARAFGFDGAICIHPSAVEILNEAFGVAPTDLDWARRVVAGAKAAEAKGEGAFVVDGHMADAATVVRARAIITRWERAAGPEGRPPHATP